VVAKDGLRAVIEALNLAGRELSSSSMFFHSLMAEQFGLTVTDWRAWDVVLRHGPLTAGELAQRTGLTPGAVTGLIDRLVELGAVERVRDTEDRRKVLVRASGRLEQQEEANQLFRPMVEATEKLYADYTEAQLKLVTEFMTRMAALLREQTAGLRGKSAAPAPNPPRRSVPS
jgi:DNA-binding MarR family transcriptional regulator